MFSCRQYNLMCCRRRWGSKWIHYSRICSTVGSVVLLQNGHCSLSTQCTFRQVGLVLSLVSMTSLCLEFCLEGDQGPSCGLMSCIYSSLPSSSHVYCRCCFMWCCSMTLQSSTGNFLLTGSGSLRASFASSSAFSFSGILACPGIQRKDMFWSAGIFLICAMMW